jgi:ketosteroid isomerase-like protein
VTSEGGDHVELIRQAFRMYDEGDFDALWALAHPDVQLHPVFM